MPETSSTLLRKSVSEYIQALKTSPKYGPQVVCHRSFPKSTGTYSPFPNNLPKELIQCLKDQGIERLYRHQQKAHDHIRDGDNVIVATPTSSGKSLIYNLPVLESILQKNDTKALYLFPLKALAQDQLRVLKQFESLNEQKNGSTHTLAAIYDGDTSAWSRQKIRKSPPNVIITNPDMLHLSFLPYHENWAHFFKKIQYIVIDEVHIYRGIFGSHMAWVLKRLQRILSLYGSEPVFILLSATIGNPQHFGKSLIGKKVISITESGAPTPQRNMIFLNPFENSAHTVSRLLEASLKRGLRTIVYTGSRKMTELITMWTQSKLGTLSGKLSSYRSGFLPEERRIIEKDLSSGKLLGVISTSALELGIDVGDLDICILAGYPGSIMATWQRGGRVGRGIRESAIILVAQEDALDQYFMKNHNDFFSRPVESAVLNPLNPEIMEQHLHCAAAELTIHKTEIALLLNAVGEVVNRLTRNGVLLQGADGNEWFATRKFPQRLMSLRGGGKQLQIIREDNGEILGTIDSGRALKECHEGAIYLHSSKTWLVLKCDIEYCEIVVSEFIDQYHTRPLSEKQIEILEVLDRKTYAGYSVSLGRLRVSEKVTGYQKRINRSNKLLSTTPLDLPEQLMETVGIWIDIPDLCQDSIIENKLHFMGAIHALEHAMIGVFPLLVLCDRNDIGGLSCNAHHQSTGAVIFIYDGYTGGMGLCSDAFSRVEELLNQTSKTVTSCHCKNGCPSCIHSPKCGSGNRPIDKAACVALIKLLLDPPQNQLTSERVKPIQPSGLSTKGFAGSSENNEVWTPDNLPAHYGVFDLETKFSASEVGGWHNAHRMGISVAVVYDSILDDYLIYYEDKVDQLVEHLLGMELVIGFNNRRFDNSVLSGYTNKNLNKMVIIDLLEIVKNRLGYRLSLDRLAKFTLGNEKSADGLQALKWYQQGEMEKLSLYCRKDVTITRDLFLYGLKHEYFLFQNKAGKLVRLPVDLVTEIRKVCV